MAKLEAALISAAILMAVAIPVLLHYHQRALQQRNVRLAQAASDLSTSNQLLQARVEALQSNLEAAERRLSQAGPAAGRSVQNAVNSERQGTAAKGSVPGKWAGDPEVIGLKKSNLTQIQFETLDHQLELTGAARDLMQLTAQETEKVNATLRELKERINAHDLAAARQVPADAITDADIVRFLKDRPGAQTAYRVPPFGQEEQQALRAWLNQNISDTLGADRTKMFVDNSRYALDFWFGGTEDKLLAFVDRQDEKGTPVTAWMIKFNTPSSSGTRSSDADPNGVPPQFSYLFEMHRAGK